VGYFLDSRLRGNDSGKRVQGRVPAEGLGVSPNSLFLIPQEWGMKGVE
jgi:hypothetical protein